jgi:hypothetical protein
MTDDFSLDKREHEPKPRLIPVAFWLALAIILGCIVLPCACVWLRDLAVR